MNIKNQFLREIIEEETKKVISESVSVLIQNDLINACKIALRTVYNNADPAGQVFRRHQFRSAVGEKTVVGNAQEDPRYLVVDMPMSGRMGGRSSRSRAMEAIKKEIMSNGNELLQTEIKKVFLKFELFDAYNRVEFNQSSPRIRTSGKRHGIKDADPQGRYREILFCYVDVSTLLGDSREN